MLKSSKADSSSSSALDNVNDQQVEKKTCQNYWHDLINLIYNSNEYNLSNDAFRQLLTCLKNM